MFITKNQLESMDKFKRVNLVNCLSGFKSANLIGTINSNKQTNLSIISSFVHAGSNPPCFACIFRPPKVERHTFENIIKTKFFTVNHVSKSFIDKYPLY